MYCVYDVGKIHVKHNESIVYGCEYCVLDILAIVVNRFFGQPA